MFNIVPLVKEDKEKLLSSTQKKNKKKRFKKKSKINLIIRQ